MNKFRHIYFINNNKTLYGHFCSRCFSLSVSTKNNKETQNLQKPPDPIYEKFDKLLNSLSTQQGNDFEFPTNFGSIRFDSDLNFTSLEKLSNRNESNFEKNGNYIEDTFFDNSFSQRTYEVNDQLNISSKEFRDQDLNYIDDQYLKVGSISDTNTSLNYNSEMKPDNSTLNFIDSQIVGLSNQTELDAGVNQTISETELDAGVCQTITETELDKVVNHTFTKTELNAGVNPIITETELDAGFNQTIPETELISEENVEYAKDKLSCYYNFEDSIDEAEGKNFIKKDTNHDNKVHDEEWRISIENRFLKITEEGNKFIKELNQPRETKNKVIEQKNTDLDSDEQELKSEPEEEKKSTLKSAYSYVREKRREETISKMGFQGEISDNERYKKILLEVPSFSLHTTYDLANLLRTNILFQNDDFLAISKPYGVAIHGGGSKANDRLNIIKALPVLAELIKVKKLEAVHRLDRDATGVLLLAKTDEMAEDLKKMFKEHKIKKTYCAIVKGVPEHVNGVIDIPIGEGKVGNLERMVLRPNISGFRGKASKYKKAITRYKVVSTSPGATLLEINPITGVKHQIRVHLGFGLNCPIIGDHKYSYLDKMVPQKLSSAALHGFGIKQSKVRNLPLYLHSLAVTLPIIGSKGTEIAIGAVPPKFFRMTLKALKLSSMRSRLTHEYSDLIFGEMKDSRGRNF